MLSNTANNLPRLTLRKVLFWWAFWTLIGVAYTSQLYFEFAAHGSHIPWQDGLLWSLENWYLWGILSIPISILARRFPVTRDRWYVTVPLHALAGVVFVMLYMLLRIWLGRSSAWAGGQPVSFFIVYCEIVAACHAIDYYRKYAQGEARAAELRRQLAQAQLLALQMQLNPHFLFNTLNSISALIHKDVEAADRMITQFGDLLRRTLSASNEPEVTLEREIAFLNDYLAIEKARFGDRLRVTVEVPPEALHAAVPNLILQPLVENAIKHGIAPHAREGNIRIEARRNNGQLSVEVLDNGKGIDASSPPLENIGLSNTRARLHQLYGDQCDFKLANRPEGGLGVIIRIPYKTLAATTAKTAKTA